MFNGAWCCIEMAPDTMSERGQINVQNKLLQSIVLPTCTKIPCNIAYNQLWVAPPVDAWLFTWENTLIFASCINKELAAKPIWHRRTPRQAATHTRGSDTLSPYHPMLMLGNNTKLPRPTDTSKNYQPVGIHKTRTVNLMRLKNSMKLHMGVQCRQPLFHITCSHLSEY